jgi:predicted nucleotidyltransferase
MNDIRPFLSAVATWAQCQPGVGAVVLVGSYARGSARPDSDIDLVLLLDNPQAFLADTEWVGSFLGFHRAAKKFR